MTCRGTQCLLQDIGAEAVHTTSFRCRPITPTQSSRTAHSASALARAMENAFGRLAPFFAARISAITLTAISAGVLLPM